MLRSGPRLPGCGYCSHHLSHNKSSLLFSLSPSGSRSRRVAGRRPSRFVYQAERYTTVAIRSRKPLVAKEGATLFRAQEGRAPGGLVANNTDCCSGRERARVACKRLVGEKPSG